MGTYADCITEFDYYLGELFTTLVKLGIPVRIESNRSAINGGED